MKTHLLITLLVGLLCGVSAHAQTQTVDKMASDIMGKNQQTGLTPQSLAANALVDEQRNVFANAFAGSLFFYPASGATVTLQAKSGVVQVAQAATTVAVTADDQAVTPGINTRLFFTSDDATAANRTITLSATGAIAGATYILVAPATNQMQLADSGTAKLSAAWSTTADDVLVLLFDGTSFVEVSRATN